MNTKTTLNYIVRKSNDSITKAPVLILLHGHGSNETDLFGLGQQIPANWLVVSVRGTYKLAVNSYRWYEVKLVNNKISINIDEEENSRKLLTGLISDLKSKYPIDSQKIVVAGFSQGANMAQSLGLSEPNLIAGFGVFSGRFVDELTPNINGDIALKKRKAFISHGSSDTMLPTTYANENIAKLKNLSIEISYCEDTNAHSISTKQWEEFCNWLNNFN